VGFDVPALGWSSFFLNGEKFVIFDIGSFLTLRELSESSPISSSTSFSDSVGGGVSVNKKV